jgi:hypothetical protein
MKEVIDKNPIVYNNLLKTFEFLKVDNPIEKAVRGGNIFY